MRCSRFLAAALVAAGVLGSAATASADITAFLGFSPTVATRSARGLAVGAGFTIVGFEFEYSDLVEHLQDGAPGLRTGMFNGVLQTPVAVSGLQFYGTLGAGIYREELGLVSETSLAVNVGGGVKVRLLGPLGARFDYRVFKLRGDPVKDTYHRLYAGVNLRF
jgi:hypothetical protein